MRRQYGVGGTPAGSSRDLRLDPLSLPANFIAQDPRADGGSRHIEINRERVVVRRVVRGMTMTLQLRIHDFLGIARRETEGAHALVLAHSDPSLSVPLLVTEDDHELEQQWSAWSSLFALPQIDEDGGIVPAPRRRRHNVIRIRRPRFLARRKTGYVSNEPVIHRGEAEIIARH
ncbi:MAG: hypothetical protein K2W78_02885 [Xanthobacteraceae bacterium]|nr:hypothetical protein [Xanthobacteraceae bacterium]